jgi:serine protease Do
MMKSTLIPMTILAITGSLSTAVAQVAPRARTVSSGNIYASSGSNSYVGIFLAEIDGSRAKALKLREERGVEITKVEEESPAAKAGLKVGDVVLEYNGQRVEGIEQFRRFVRETPANREVKVQVSRDGNVQSTMVKVGAKKGGMEIAMVAPRMMEMPEIRVERPGMLLWSRTALGVEADSIDGQLASYFGVKEGVLVRSVMKGSTAEKAGLRAGDVIVKVDETRIANASELTRAVRSARSASKKSFPIVVMRDKKETSLTAAPEDDDRSEWPGLELLEPRQRPVGLTIRL